MSAQCVKELHSPEHQHANTHRLFIKLCWLMDKHAVSADRVVNIDEMPSCLLPVHQIGWGRRGVKQAQLQGNTREATTFTVAFSLRGTWPAGHVGADRARGQGRRRLARAPPWPEHTRHVTSENGWATTTAILQLTTALDDCCTRARKDNRGSFSGAATPARHHVRHKGDVPSRRVVFHPAAQHVALAVVRRGRLPHLQELHPDAGERHSCPLRSRPLGGRRGHEQGVAAPVFGQMGSLRSHGRAPTATTISAWPSKRPLHSVPAMSCSPSSSN